MALAVVEEVRVAKSQSYTVICRMNLIEVGRTPEMVAAVPAAAVAAVAERSGSMMIMLSLAILSELLQEDQLQAAPVDLAHFHTGCPTSISNSCKVSTSYQTFWNDLDELDSRRGYLNRPCRRIELYRERRIA